MTHRVLALLRDQERLRPTNRALVVPARQFLAAGVIIWSVCFVKYIKPAPFCFLCFLAYCCCIFLVQQPWTSLSSDMGSYKGEPRYLVPLFFPEHKEKTYLERHYFAAGVG